MNDTIFNAMFTIIPIIAVAIFIFTFAMILSPKLRGKMLSKQIKATKYMFDEVKDELTDMATTVSDVSINVQKNILDKNEDSLRDIANRKANIHKDSIKTTVSAIKEGLHGVSTSSNNIYCKHCGESIDANSIFCKTCGKNNKSTK